MAGVSSPGTDAPAPEAQGEGQAQAHRRSGHAGQLAWCWPWSPPSASSSSTATSTATSTTDVDLDALGDDRPEKVYRGNGEPLNILVMGDDTRSGEGNEIDGETGGGGSDTTILVHLSADRKRSYAISIPRDSIVDRPDVRGQRRRQRRHVERRLRRRRASCARSPSSRQTTDILVDHFVVIDFNGFGDMVDAVDGVPVCIPEDIEDPEHEIFVPAGDPSVLSGDEALDYVRARYVGELAQQNDISRIKRQQTFIAALIRKVKSAGTLTRLDRVVQLPRRRHQVAPDRHRASASVTRIGKIALQLQNIGLDKIQFITVPTAYYPLDRSTTASVYWTEDADTMWQLINEDKALPTRLLDERASPPSRPRRRARRPSAHGRDPVRDAQPRRPQRVPDRGRRRRPRSPRPPRRRHARGDDPGDLRVTPEPAPDDGQPEPEWVRRSDRRRAVPSPERRRAPPRSPDDDGRAGVGTPPPARPRSSATARTARRSATATTATRCRRATANARTARPGGRAVRSIAGESVRLRPGRCGRAAGRGSPRARDVGGGAGLLGREERSLALV